MDEYKKKMKEIHATYKSFRGKLKKEVPEQLMIIKHLKEDDIVLEIGGSCGRASCMINSLLKNKSNHVVVEPNTDEAKYLKRNRDVNNFKFHIEQNVISKKPLYSLKWKTFDTPQEGSTKVNNITYDQLIKKYKLKFNVIIADCEGALVCILENFPNILKNVRLLQTEHDFAPNGVEGLEYFKKTMIENGFKMTDKFMKEDKGGPGINWGDGLPSDPIFVSVWKR